MSKVCLVCRDEYQEGTSMPWESSSSGGESESESLLKNHLSVILLVRKILGLSREVLETLLCERGSPCSWGVSLCGPCRRIFTEAEFIHDRISQLNGEFEGLAKKLRRLLINKGGSGDCLEIFSNNVPVPVGRSRGRPNRKRGRKRSSAVINEGNPTNGRVDGKSGMTADSIRQALFQGATKIEAQGGDVAEPEQSSPKVRKVSNPSGKHISFSAVGKMEPIDDHSENPHATSSTSDYVHDDHNVGVAFQDEVSFTGGSPEQEEADDDDAYTPSIYGSDKEGDSDFEVPEEPTIRSSRSTKGRGNFDYKKRIDVFLIEQPEKREKGYGCPLCNRVTLSKSSCHGHILRAHHNDRRPFHCHLCEKQYKRETHLRTHLDKCHEGATTPLDDPDEVYKDKVLEENLNDTSRTFECDTCPKMKYRVLYKSQETLDAHKKMVHLGIKKPYECKICGKAFKWSTVLRHHMYVHKRQEKERKVTQGQTYCNQCNRQFKNFATLRAHLKTKLHSTEFPYLCEFCTKGFMQKPSLENHRAQEHYAELNIQPFKCSLCDRILSGQRALDHHIRLVHSGETKWKCETCNVGFMFYKIYQKHIACVHEKERPFLCNYCPKRFGMKNHLDTHERVHTGEKPYKCKDCGKEYSDRPTFRRHLETHGQVVYECSKCPRKFKVWHSYRLHMKSHNINVTKRIKKTIPVVVQTATVPNDDDNFNQDDIIETVANIDPVQTEVVAWPVPSDEYEPNLNSADNLLQSESQT